MAAGLRERKKVATREAIYAAAVRHYREIGFEQTTMEMIAESAGIAVGTVYNYYTSKSDLVLAMIVEADEKCIAESTKLVSKPPRNPVNALFQIGLLQSKYSIEALDKATWRFVLSAQAGPSRSDFAERYRWTTSRLRDLFIDMLRALQKRGDLSDTIDPQEIGYYLKAMKHMLFDYFISDDNMTFEHHAREVRREIRDLYAWLSSR